MIKLVLSVATSALLLSASAWAQGDWLLVGNKGDDSVSFIDLDTGREVARRGVSGTAPHEIAVSPDGTRAAVVNYGGNAIDLFDIATKAVVETIDLGANTRPHGIVWLADGRIVATTEGSDTVVVVVEGGEVRSIATGQEGTHMLAVHGDGRRMFVANMQSATVSEIDLTRGETVRSVSAGAEPEGIAVVGDEVWVADRGGDRVLVFAADGLERLAEIAVGAFPIRILASPDGRHLVTSNLRDGSVSVIDAAAREVVRTIVVSGTAETQQVTLLFSPDGSRLYVAETGWDKIAEMDFASGEVLGRLSGGSQGDGLAIVEVP